MKLIYNLISFLLVFYIILIRLCEASKLMTVNVNPPSTSLNENSNESRTLAHLSESVLFDEAIQILNALSLSPSCNRIAADKLMTSCQAVGSDNGVGSKLNEVVDRVRSIYAARLAICELDGAFASIPTSCLAVAVTYKTPKSRFFDIFSKSQSQNSVAQDVPNEVLEPCLRSLESRPQWWTSYSNNRQNAMLLCHAARIEAEKEEVLSLHKDITESSIKLSEGLRDAVHQASMETKRNGEFSNALRVLQDSFLEKASFMEIVLSKFEPRMARLLAMSAEILGLTNFDHSITSATKNMAKMNEELEVFGKRFHHLETFLHRTAITSIELQKSQNENLRVVMAHSEKLKEITSTAQLAEALISKISVDAVYLERMIESTCVTFSNMTGMKWGGVSSWPTFIVLIISVYWRRPAFARILLSAFVSHCVVNHFRRYLGFNF